MTEENEVHFSGKVAQKAIVVKNNKVLLMQDPRETRDVWELPGGRMNSGENPADGLAREFFEELGQKIAVHEVVHVEQFWQDIDEAQALLIAYRATLEHDDFILDETEVSKVQWFSADDVQRLEIYPEHKQALSKYFNSIAT